MVHSVLYEFKEDFQTFSDTDEIVKMRKNVILNRSENSIILSPTPCLPLMRRHSISVCRLQLGRKSSGSFGKCKNCVNTERGITRARLKQYYLSFKELSIHSACTHTYARRLAQRSQEGCSKSISELSLFTFISYLFLIHPPFWRFFLSFHASLTFSAVMLLVPSVFEEDSQSIGEWPCVKL